jgi:hypothetical protein
MIVKGQLRGHGSGGNQTGGREGTLHHFDGVTWNESEQRAAAMCAVYRPLD